MSTFSSPSPAVSPARAALLTEEICAAGFYRFGHLSFYPENHAKNLGISWIRIEPDCLRVSDGCFKFDWLGTFSELLEHQKSVLNR